MSRTMIDEALTAYDDLQVRVAELREMYDNAEESGYIQEYADADELRDDLNSTARDLLDTLVAVIKADRLRHEVLQVHLCGECDDADYESGEEP